MPKKEALRAFLLCAIVLILDQVTKAIIVLTVPQGTIGASVIGDFFWIVHDRNTGMAFSMLGTADTTLRVIVLMIVPLLVMSGLIVYIIRAKQISAFQRLLLGGILGGGLGNLIDRIFRQEGVVDFFSFKFYGLFGLERFPTFNIADSALVVSSILLAVNLLFFSRDTQAKKQPEARR